MKTSQIASVFLAGLLVAAGASRARADERIVVHVPFDFIVGTTELPAGEYFITEDTSQSGGVLAIERTDGRRSAFVLSISADSLRPSKSELVFEKFENKYFLSKVSNEDGEAREIPLNARIMHSELVRVQAAAPSAVVTP